MFYIYIKSDPLRVSLNIFILHQFSEKQVLTTYTTNLSRFCFLGTAPVLAPNMWANEKNPKVDTRSRESNSGPQDCEADVLPHGPDTT